MKRAQCNSCGAIVIWAVTAKGKWMPVDAEPTPDGNVKLEPLGIAAPRAIVYPQPPLDGGGDLRLPHHATCPQADKWRRS